MIDRVLRRAVEAASGCWVFQGALSEGYGKVGLGGKSEGIDFCHRVTYCHFIGEIPDGLDLDHLCRNRACCNPWHLDPVTRLVNVRRGARTGHTSTHCKRGHEKTDENTRWVGKYRACRQCNRELTRATYYEKKSAA